MVSFKEDYKTKWLTLHTICIVRAPATYQPWFCRWDLMGWDYGVSAMRSISALVRRTRHRMGSVIHRVSATLISIFLIRMTALCTKRDMRSHQDWPLGGLDYQGRPQKTVLIRVLAQFWNDRPVSMQISNKGQIIFQLVRVWHLCWFY